MIPAPVEGTARAAVVPIAAVAIPTRGPSPHLRRLLGALVGCGRAVRVYVDDPDPAAADRVRADVVALGLTGATVSGARERAAHVRALAEASGRPDAVDAALVAPAGLAWRIGALRNLVLLDGVGERVVSVDDDVVPEVRPPPAAAPGPRAVGGLDPTGWWPSAAREAAWAGARPADLAAVHEAWVGHSAAALLGPAVAPSGSDLAREVDAGASVVVSTLGIAGDNGASRCTTWLAAPPAARAAMLRLGEAPWLERTICRVAPAATVTDAPFFMAPCFAFDGRALLPPYLPTNRNTDGLWGVCLRRAVRPGLVAHLPLAVRHDPPGHRRWAAGDLARDAVGFRTTDLLVMHVAGARLGGATPSERLAALARHVGALASLPAPALADVTATLARAWVQGMGKAIEVARVEGGPPGWIAELDAAAAATRAAAAAPPFPAEHVRDGRADLDGLRRDLLRFAVALDGWEALRRGAAALRGAAAPTPVEPGSEMGFP